MAISTPGFTVSQNLNQLNVNSIDILSNLLSTQATKRFDVIKGAGSDLQVFQNNINSQTDFVHFNRITKGEDHIVENVLPFTLAGRTYIRIKRVNESISTVTSTGRRRRGNFRRDLSPTIVIEPNGESFSPEITPTVFDFDGFLNNGVWDFDTPRDTVHLYFGQWIGIPNSYFNNASPAGSFTPLAKNDPIKVIDPNDPNQQKYQISFTTNDELKVQIPIDEKSFTEADDIISVTLDRDTSIVTSGSFTITGASAATHDGTYEYYSSSNEWRRASSSDSPEDSPYLGETIFALDAETEKWTYNYGGNNRIFQTTATAHPFTNPSTWVNAPTEDGSISINIFNSATFDSSGATIPDTDTVFTGNYTIKDYVLDYDAGVKSFVLGGLTFSDSPDNQTDVTNTFNTTSIRITRKNGVTKENFYNALEYDTDLYSDPDDNPVRLYEIDKDKTYNDIFANIDTNIKNARATLEKLIIRREDTQLTDNVVFKGICRFKDTKSLVSESDSTINENAAGIFLLRSELNASPQVFKRAFSEISSVWEVNSSNDNIQLQSGANITNAKVEGKLIFEESIKIDLEDGSPESDISVIDLSPHGEANGTSAEFDDTLNIPLVGDVFSHRLTLEVEEVDEDGDTIIVEYGVLAIRPESS